LVKARRGQGRFREDLLDYWGRCCAVLGCNVESILRASHIKPWSKSTDDERLDPNNGLLLVANLDALFNNGLITFSDDGRMIVSDLLSQEERALLQLHCGLRKPPSERQRKYLQYHRRELLSVRIRLNSFTAGNST